MMRYKCVVSYVGRNYSGWQSQRKGDSIQEILEAVIERITQETVNVIGSGRTDSGVNAKAQVFMLIQNVRCQHVSGWAQLMLSFQMIFISCR